MDTLLINDNVVALVWRHTSRDVIAAEGHHDPAGLIEVPPEPVVYQGMIRQPDGSFIMPDPSTDRRRLIRATRAKALCQSRIYSVVSDVAQRNIAAYLVELSFKATLTADEQADVATARNVRDWISATVAECRRLVADDTAKADWPAMPDAISPRVLRRVTWASRRCSSCTSATGASGRCTTARSSRTIEMTLMRCRQYSGPRSCGRS